MTTINAPAGWTFRADPILESITCGECGVIFAMPEKMLDARRTDGQRFWCPNGHCRVFNHGKTEAEVLAGRLKDARNSITYQQRRAEEAERRAAAQRGVATRHRRERDEARAIIGEGVCPVDGCRRHFKDVERHMARVHPDYGNRANLPREEA